MGDFPKAWVVAAVAVLSMMVAAAIWFAATAEDVRPDARVLAAIAAVATEPVKSATERTHGHNKTKARKILSNCALHRNKKKMPQKLPQFLTLVGRGSQLSPRHTFQNNNNQCAITVVVR